MGVVTVATYRAVQEASVAMKHLEMNGVECILIVETASSPNLVIRLQVLEENVETATNLLRMIEEK